ncbi:Ydc2-catalyt-domain-containing protein [Hypoxylon trugodes]|uniref:Ydc2-catalyt-domain-containing protein n=1 Tax=Hypoxylon trugodes TaxID=326681 RepID=UPI002190541C|nr:Ydc2-catalyt-domain-containing protein [Hypoxylon trugodes]KAI1388683.1 Ydc2-catalyt-domain-containing protein [Hypoxylon trugodes]
MSSKLEKLLHKLKSPQLKHLTFLCGAKSSGLKSDLIERLTALAAGADTRVTKPTKSKTQPLILSIDLGIRNLGFSLLSPATPRKTRSLASVIPTLLPNALREPLPIRLHVWERRDLIPPAPLSLSSSASGQKPDPDLFTPFSLALAADRLVRQDLLPLKPTHILIERQRWRSAGGAAVQEWTLRVNTLEAMLHASLRTLQELGYWGGVIASVAPDRVTRFWPAAPLTSVLRGKHGGSEGRRSGEGVVVGEGKSKGRGGSRQNSKKHKIGVLKNWLAREDGSEVILPANQETEDAVKQFRSKLTPTRGRKSKTADEGLVTDAGSRKLDDLTDSLLQGVAWLKWEENKKLLLSAEGIEKLLDSNLLDEQETDTIVDDEV